MSRVTQTWKRFRRWPAQHRAQLRLCLRVTTSAVVALAVAHFLNLPLALWTVLTAVLLTQISVGRSLKATVDYLASTLGGAIYAGAVGTLVPHADEIALLGTLAIAVAPPALLAATNPRFSAAPFSAVMVFFAPTITHAGPIASAVERVTEVAVGAVVGFVVSFLVLPARAHELMIEAAGRMLALIAQALPQLCGGFSASLDEAAIRRIQEPLGDALARLNGSLPKCGMSRSPGSRLSRIRGRCCARCCGCGTTSSCSAGQPWCRCRNRSEHGWARRSIAWPRPRQVICAQRAPR